MTVNINNTNIGWQDAINPEKIRWIDQYIDFSTEPKILELGAGAGWYSKYLADKGCSVTSLDQSPLFKDSRIDIKVVNLEDKLDFANEVFDYVIAWDIIEHVSNDKQLLFEIHRVAKAGAKVLVSVPHVDDSRIASSYFTYCHFKDKTHEREYTQESLNNDFKNNGFIPLEIKFHGGAGYPYILSNFIDNKLVKLLIKVQIKIMMITKIINVKNCHGDIFAVFVK